jgi:hypothetical protein
MNGSGTTVRARKVDSARGLRWWTDAWALFTRNPGMWIVYALAIMILFVLLAMIPVVGSLAGSLLAPVLIGGWLLALRNSDAGGKIEFGDLFACFRDKERLTPLLIVGAWFVVANLVIGIVLAALGLGSMMGGIGGIGGLASGHGGFALTALAGVFLALLIALLIALILAAVVATAMWFAPALVVFRNVPPVEALKESVNASLANWMPFLAFGVIYLIAAAFATLLLGLGWILLAPLSMLTMYVSYKDLYDEPGS